VGVALVARTTRPIHNAGTSSAVAAAALARQDLRRLRHLALWAAVVSLLSLIYPVDFSGLQMNISLIQPFPAQLVSAPGHLL